MRKLASGRGASPRHGAHLDLCRPRQAFEKIWKNGLLFVIHNRMESARFNLAADWRVAPRAPLGNGVHRDGLAGTALPKLGPGDF